MESALDLLCKLAKIPAPSHHEEKRAEFCKKWLTDAGKTGVYIDGALNVVCPFGNIDGELVVIMAHSDVVFPDTEELPLRIEGNRVYCPGVGDDTANAVGVLKTAEYIVNNKLTPKSGGVLLVINSCEEGLGNLKGCREIFKKFGDRVKEFITLDGSIKTIHGTTVGSRRFKVEVTTEGGHSYQDFGNKNSIACLASLIHNFYKIEVPKIGRTTYNVGLISGGTSVNTIAQNAEALIEFRSDSREALDIMQAEFDRVIANAEGDIKVTLIGDRPCAGDIDKVKQTALEDRILAAVKKHFGHDATRTPGSTDCNIPASMGIPSVSVGVIRCGGAHTRGEYVEIDTIEPGMELAKEIICYYFE
ncbi:MAG: M20/M25/M40 family metallo-hydrolase [Clostridia bacterium]|nr:M20/M25/M40 family metallo-hydrolase [Clostridia bacterium]